jgi:hypothetical protein
LRDGLYFSTPYPYVHVRNGPPWRAFCDAQVEPITRQLRPIAYMDECKMPRLHASGAAAREAAKKAWTWRPAQD